MKTVKESRCNTDFKTLLFLKEIADPCMCLGSNLGHKIYWTRPKTLSRICTGVARPNQKIIDIRHHTAGLGAHVPEVSMGER